VKVARTVLKGESGGNAADLLNTIMTYAQIKKSVGNAWAFLGNPVYKNGVLQAADLLYYDADKSKVAERLMTNKKGHYAMFYFGDVNAEQAYLL